LIHFIFLFLFLPHPPISTLFPYTTLFRSEIKDVPPRAVVIQRRDRALNNVVNVSVIALSRAIAELIDRLVGQNLASELMNRQIRSEEHTSELQSQSNLVCRLLLEKKKKNK